MRETCVDLQSQDNYTLFHEMVDVLPTDSEYLRSGMRYMIHNEKQAGVEWFDLIQTFHACKQEKENQLAHMSLDEEVCGTGTSWLCAPTELSYANGLPKKAETPQVMMIKGGKIQKSNKKSLKAKEVGHCKRNCHAYLAKLIKKKNCGTQICNTKHGFGGVRKLKQVEAIGSFDIDLPDDLVICLDNCHYAHSIIKGVVSVHRLVENGLVQCFTDFGFSVSKNNVFYFNAIPSNGIYEIDMHNLVPNVNSMYNVSTKRATHNLDSTYLGHCHFAYISKKRIEKLQQGGLLKSKDDESFDHCVSCLSVKMTRKSFPHRLERGCEALVKRDTPGKLQQRSAKCIFIGYPKETMGYYFYFPPENKIVVARYAEFFEKNFITQEVNGRAIDLEEIQDEDTSSSKITSEIPMEVEGFKPPQEEEIPIRRSEMTRRTPNRLCLNVEAEEPSLGDLNEPTSYKAAMLDSESNKWIDAMNAAIQSVMDNMVWVLVDLPPGCKTVGSKWIFKKKTDMDGIVHTYKAHLVAKGYTQLYGVNYEETRFQRNPGEGHWTAVKNILKYLRNTKDMFLVYGGNLEAELQVDCYCNAGFETDIDDMKSLARYVSDTVDGDTESSFLKYFPYFDQPFEEVVYPKGEIDAVSIGKRDVDMLLPDTFVNDTITDFYIKLRFHFLNSFFFRKLADLDKEPIDACKRKEAFQRVRKWTRKVNLFEKDYIFIPISYNYHWSIIVMCHLGELATYQDEDVTKLSKVFLETY
ncbi:retrotransposon protein, putative, ty1-copia subclass [Tanacetum coccineum]